MSGINVDARLASLIEDYYATTGIKMNIQMVPVILAVNQWITETESMGGVITIEQVETAFGFASWHFFADPVHRTPSLTNREN